MADIWIEGSFAFRCSAAEAALLTEAVNASHNIDAGFWSKAMPGEPACTRIA